MHRRPSLSVRKYRTHRTAAVPVVSDKVTDTCVGGVNCGSSALSPPRVVTATGQKHKAGKNLDRFHFFRPAMLMPTGGRSQPL